VSIDTLKMPRWRKMAIVGSAVLCVAIWFCHLVQLDWFAPVILVPNWCWLLPGMTLVTLGYNRDCKFRCITVLAFWGIFTVMLVEQAQSLVRIKSWPTTEWKEVCERGRGIRVVSLNCGGGQANSAKEVAAWKPDIVLLQESPSRQRVEQLSQDMFGATGAFLYGGDTSILTGGQLRPKTPIQTSHFVHAEVRLPTGLQTDVISVRLAPPVFRIDFWMPGFWIDHRDKRMKHREEIADIMQRVQSIPRSSNVIVGGDFNSPPSDDALAPLRQRMFDTFRKAGRGWGSTGTNDYPLFRVDQIWVSQGFRAESVTAQKTRHSDHRMVVCDLILKD